MICSKIITSTLFNTRNIFVPIIRSHSNVYSFSNYKPPLPTDIDIANLKGLLTAN